MPFHCPSAGGQWNHNPPQAATRRPEQSAHATAEIALNKQWRVCHARLHAVDSRPGILASYQKWRQNREEEMLRADDHYFGRLDEGGGGIANFQPHFT